MSAPNGHAQKYRAPESAAPPAMLAPGDLQVPAEQVKELVAALEVPFDPSQIEWLLRLSNACAKFWLSLVFLPPML